MKKINEGMNNTPDEGSYTHYAIHKPTGKIVFSWDYNGYEGEELRQFKKDYFMDDLDNMGLNPKECKILTLAACKRQGIDPDDDNSWSNGPSMYESVRVKACVPRVKETLRKAHIQEMASKGNAYSLGRYLAEAIKYSAKKTIWSSFLNEGVQFEPGENEKGGIIVFSTDVNAVQLDGNKFINWFKQKTATIVNRFKATSKVDQIAQQNNLIGWTIGHYLSGRYTAKNGKSYGENSLSVEIIGVDIETLTKIAEELAVAFKQESVLLKDFSSGRVMFVEP